MIFKRAPVNKPTIFVPLGHAMSFKFTAFKFSLSRAIVVFGIALGMLALFVLSRFLLK